jgi:hypothetical protein
LFALLAATLGQLLVFAAAFAVSAFDFAGNFLLASLGVALGPLCLSSCFLLTLLTDLASFTRRYIVLWRRRDQRQAPED